MVSTEQLPNIFAPGIAITEEQARGLSGIYRITSPTGRVYVGQAQCIATRWNGHRRGSTNHLLAASIAKYGADAHNFEVVEVVCKLDLLTQREQGWIDALSQAASAGLVKKMNLSPTAGNPRGYKFNDEQRARSSAAAKRRASDPQWIANVKARSTSYFSDPANRAKVRAAAHSPQAREKRLAAQEKRRIKRAAEEAEYAAAMYRLNAQQKDERAMMVVGLGKREYRPFSIDDILHARYLVDVNDLLFRSIETAFEYIGFTEAGINRHTSVKFRKTLLAEGFLAVPFLGSEYRFKSVDPKSDLSKYGIAQLEYRTKRHRKRVERDRLDSSELNVTSYTDTFDN